MSVRKDFLFVQLAGGQVLPFAGCTVLEEQILVLEVADVETFVADLSLLLFESLFDGMSMTSRPLYRARQANKANPQ